MTMHPQCHPDLTDQMDQDVPDGVDDIEKKGQHEDKSPHLQGQGCQRCSDLPKLEVGFNQCINMQGAGIAPSYLYAIRSLQGYPGEFVRSSGMDITLDDVLTILDEHYNNVKVLDALNQELFQLQMADKETGVRLGCICHTRHLQVLAASFPDHFPLDCVVELKRYHFYGRLPK